MKRALVLLSLWMGLGLRALAEPSAATSVPELVVLPEVAASAEEQPRDKPAFAIGLTLDNALGSGVLATQPYTTNPSYSINLYASPSYTFGIGGHQLKATAREILTYTPRVDNNASTNRRFDWSDLWLTISDSKVYEEPHTHLKLGASLRGVVPISYTSRYATMITAIAPGVNVSKSFSRVDLSAGFAVQKNFFRSTSAGTPCSSPTPIVLNSGATVTGFEHGVCRDGDPSVPSGSAMNADFSLIPSVAGTYHFTDKLTFSLSFYYFDSFLYPVPVDGFSTHAQDTSGEQIVQSQGRVDAIWGITSLGYSIDEHWGLSFGIWNNSSPRSPDAQGYNFPFADVTSLASNQFVFFFDINASI